MKTRLSTISIVALSTLTFFLALVDLTLAANDAFTNTVGGSWEVPGNWSLGATPTSADTALLTNNGTYTVNINDTTANTDPGGAGSWMTNANLYVGNLSGAPTLLIDFTNAAKTFFVGGASSGYTSVGGFANQQGTITMSNGQFSTYGLHVADASGTVGNLNVYNGLLTVRDTATAFANAFLVGAAANSTGNVLLAGGTIDHTGGYAVLGAASGALGTMTISNGTFKTAYEVLGYSGNMRGVLNIYGGTNISNGGYLSIANNPNATGTVLVAGGTLIQTNNTTYLGFGSGALGTLTLSNGNVSLDTVIMADSGSSGRWNIYGGTTLVNGVTHIGGTTAPGGNGVLTVTGGLLNFHEVRLGSQAGSRGDWNISGGSISLNNSTLSLAYAANSTGTVLMTGGVLDAGTGQINIGLGGQGTVTISNGLFKAAIEELGASGAGSSGTVNLYGGTNLITGSTFSLANNNSTTGAYLVAGGTLLATNGTTFLGFGTHGLGTLTSSNSTVMLGTVDEADGAGVGRWSIVGGTTTVYSTTSLGGAGFGGGGQAQLDVSGGALLNLNFTANIGSQTGSRGDMTINNSTVNIASGSGLTFGTGNSTGTLMMASGVLDAGGSTVFLGFGANSRGDITISNGLFKTQVEELGVSGAGSSGSVNLYGGTNLITGGTFVIGNAASATGTVLVAGGTLIATNSTTYLGFGSNGSGTLTQSNGVVALNSVDVADNGAVSRWTIAGGTTTVYGAISLGGTATFGGGGHAQLNVSGGVANFNQILVGSYINSDGAVTVSGGSNTITVGSGNALVLGNSLGSTGTVTITGGSLDAGSGATLIGNSGPGTLTVSNGIFQSKTVTMGVLSGASGVWNIFGGTNTLTATTGNSLILGNNGTGTVFLAGGVLDTGAGSTLVGSSGAGQMTMSNGVFNTQSLTLGTLSGANGTFNLFGGTATVNSGQFAIGNNPGGTGTVLMAGGALNQISGTTYIGFGSGGLGTLTVSNGTANLSTVDIADSSATGRWNMYGGLSTVAGTITSHGGGGILVSDSAILELKSSTAVSTGYFTNQNGGTVRFTAQNSPSITGNSIVSTNATIEFKDAAAANVSGTLTKINMQGNNMLSLNNATNANIGAYTFQTNASQTFASLRMINGGTRWQSTGTTIGNGSSLLASNTIGTVQGSITNLGTIHVANSKMTFENTVLINGKYASDPSTNIFLADVTVSQSGSLAGGAGDLFDFKKSLFINSTNRFGFDLAKSAVEFSGGGIHTNAITGQDFGTNDLGYAANFAYGELHLGSTNDQICFTCGNIPAIASNGLYVGWLDLLGSTNFVANLHATNTIHIYYDQTDTRNAYLGGLSYSLTDCDLVSAGGMLMPVIPEPTALAWFGAVFLLFLRRILTLPPV